MIKVQAHRGASGYAPENTLPSFRKAVEMQADGIECDVHCTKDKVIVVCHDETIDRTSNGKGAIADMTLDELKKYDFGCRYAPEFQGTQIPTLEEMLAVVSGLEIINIEIKVLSEEALEIFYKTIKKFNVIQQVLVSSFNADSLKTLKQMHKDVKTAYLYGEYPGDVIAFCKEIGADAIHPHWKPLNKEIIATAKANGLDINPWTANTEEEIRALIDLGVTGVITDFPDRAKALGFTAML